MRYSEELIEEVRSRNDIVDVISGYVKLKKSGSNYFGLCPFHNEKSGSFSVSPSKQMYYCFGCGAGGNVITFIMEYENYTFMEAVRMLAERAGIELPQMEETPEERKSRDIRSQLLEINKIAALIKQLCLRGIKVLWLAVSHNTSTKSDNPVIHVHNRKHYTVPELVRNLAVTICKQSRLLQDIILVAFTLYIPVKIIAVHA